MKKIIYSPGEPAGIGPDLIIKLAISKSWEAFKIPIITIGDPDLFLDRAKLLKKRVGIIEINNIQKAKKNKSGSIQLIKVSKCKSTSAGKILKSNAKYVLDNLNYAIKETIINKKTALVTGPLNKEALISIEKCMIFIKKQWFLLKKPLISIENHWFPLKNWKSIDFWRFSISSQ